MKKAKDENNSQVLNLFLDFGYYTNPIIITYSGKS